MLRQFWMAIAEPEVVVVVVKVIGCYLLPFLDGHNSPAGEGEVVLRVADCVRCAGMVQNRGDGEESLDVNIFVWVFTNNICICIYHSWNVW